MALTPIRPRNPTMNLAKNQAAVTAYLRGFSSEFVREIAKYPPPGSSRYRRTGTLGRNWSTRIRFTKDSVTIENPTPYGIYVQGDPAGPQRRRQTPLMQRRGWSNVKQVGERTRDHLLPVLRKELGK